MEKNLQDELKNAKHGSVVLQVFYLIYNTPLPPRLDALAVGVKPALRSDTDSITAGSPIDPPRNLIPPELVTSQLPLLVVVALRRRFSFMNSINEE